MAGAALLFDQAWLLVPLFYGFLARVLSGPRFSPLGLLATRVVAPRIKRAPKLVAGPPKRFAQGIGLAFVSLSIVVTLTAGWGVGRWILVPLVLAASLEAGLGLCLGCVSFSWLMKAGVIPEEVCEACANVGTRVSGAAG